MKFATFNIHFSLSRYWNVYVKINIKSRFSHRHFISAISREVSIRSVRNLNLGFPLPENMYISPPCTLLLTITRLVDAIGTWLLPLDKCWCLATNCQVILLICSMIYNAFTPLQQATVKTVLWRSVKRVPTTYSKKAPLTFKKITWLNY